MQIKHITHLDDLLLISKYLDDYYDERLQLMAMIIPTAAVLAEGDDNSVDYRLTAGVNKFFTDQLKINSHETELLEKMLRYLQLMETNNKMDEYNRKYRALFYRILMELDDSRDQRFTACDAFAEAAITGYEYETTDLAIASNVDFMTPHLSSAKIEAYKDIIPRK